MKTSSEFTEIISVVCITLWIHAGKPDGMNYTHKKKNNMHFRVLCFIKEVLILQPDKIQFFLLSSYFFFNLSLFFSLPVKQRWGQRKIWTADFPDSEQKCLWGSRMPCALQKVGSNQQQWNFDANNFHNFSSFYRIYCMHLLQWEEMFWSSH